MHGNDIRHIVIDEINPVQPALTPEGWRNWLDGTRELRERAPLSLTGSLGMAAIALHEHPQGFTWTDHDLLMNMAASAELDAEEFDGTAREGLAKESACQRAADLRNLAARIAALLAPR